MFHEFGAGREIPVRVTNTAVPEIGGQRRKPPFDILAGPVPGQQRLHGEAMAKIVKTRAGVVRRSPETDPTGKLPEDPMNVLDQQAATVLGDEEIRAASPIGLVVPARRIPPQHLPGRGMHRHEARLAELRVSDGEDALPQIDVIPPYPEGFADAQSGNGQKPKQAMEGPSPQSGDGRQVQRRGQQPLDLLIGVEVRLGAPIGGRVLTGGTSVCGSTFTR